MFYRTSRFGIMKGHSLRFLFVGVYIFLTAVKLDSCRYLVVCMIDMVEILHFLPPESCRRLQKSNLLKPHNQSDQTHTYNSLNSHVVDVMLHDIKIG